MKFVGLQRKIVMLAGILLLAWLNSGCGDWVARVDGKTIDQNTFNRRLAEMQARYGGQAPTEADEERFVSFRGTVAEDLVVRELLRDQAEQLGLAVSESEIDQGLEEVKKNKFGGDQQKLMEALEREGITLERAREQLADGMLLVLLKKRITGDVPPPSDDEIKVEYERNPKKFELAPSVKLRHILVGTEAEAKDVQARLNQGADMTALAAELSKDGNSKDKGGDLGWAPRGSMDQSLDDAAFSLTPGAYSAPVQSKHGWHVLLIEEAKPAYQRTFEEARETVKKELLENARDTYWSDWLSEIKRNARIEYRNGYKPPEEIS